MDSAGRFDARDLQTVKRILPEGLTAARADFGCTLRIAAGRHALHLTALYDAPRAMLVFTVEETEEEFGSLANAVARAVELLGCAWVEVRS